MSTSSGRSEQKMSMLSSGISLGSFKELLVERPAERVLLVRFNRPTVRNALKWRAYYELIRLVKTVTYDPIIAIVVFTGVGDAFSSGNDIKESGERLRSLFATSDNQFENERLSQNRRLNFILRSLARSMVFCPKILIALVNGVSIGIGFTLAAFCDIVYCTENAYFEAPFARLGLCPEMSSSFLFPRILGLTKAFEVYIFGGKLTADEAFKYGFVARVFKNDELETQFWPKIIEWSMLPSKSLEISKRLISEPTRQERLNALEKELTALEQLRYGPDHISEIGKFLEKSKKPKSML